MTENSADTPAGLAGIEDVLRLAAVWCEPPADLEQDVVEAVSESVLNRSPDRAV